MPLYAVLYIENAGRVAGLLRAEVGRSCFNYGGPAVYTALRGSQRSNLPLYFAVIPGEPG